MLAFILAAALHAADVRKMLVDRAGDARGVGIVVGIVSPAGRRVIASNNFNGDTAFEIGSVTKVFTALLLADMVERGELALNDPARKFVKDAPSAITLVDLATHTSGLGFMEYRLRRDPGTEWEYSNVGYWLLARALSSRARTDYGTLLRRRVLVPLGLHDTTFRTLATGHDASGQPAPSISSVEEYAKMPAAGGLVSTTNDLLTFLETVLRLKSSPLASAIALTLRVRRPKSANQEQALGWVIEPPLIFHDGGTLGYASAIACDPAARTCVTVLMNQAGDVSDIARHLLRPDFPLAKGASTKHVEIMLDRAALDAFAGKYEAAGEGVFTIAREGELLTFEAPADWGLPKLRLHAESSRDFFATELPLRVSFQDGGMLIYPPRGQKPILATNTLVK